MSSKRVAAAKKQKSQARKAAAVATTAAAPQRNSTNKVEKKDRRDNKDDYLEGMIGGFERLEPKDSNGSGRMIVDFKKDRIPANAVGKDYLSKLMEELEKKPNTGRATKSGFDISEEEDEEEDEEEGEEEGEEEDGDDNVELAEQYLERLGIITSPLSQREQEFMEELVAAFEKNDESFMEVNRDPEKLKRQLEDNLRNNAPIFKKLNEAFEADTDFSKLEKAQRLFVEHVVEKLKKPGVAEKYYKEPNPTFWYSRVGPQTSLGFMILNAEKNGLNRQEALNRFYKPWIFIWLPHLLPTITGSKLKCPKEGCNGDFNSNGFTTHYPYRKVLGMQSKYYVATHTYTCTGKNAHIVDGLDNKVVDQLYILGSEMECPIAYTTDKFAIDDQLHKSTTMYRKCGMNVNKIVDSFKQMHVRKIRDDSIYATLAQKRLDDEAKSIKDCYRVSSNNSPQIN